MCGQTPHEVDFDYTIKFDLEGQGQLPSKTMKDLNQCFAPLIQIWWSKLERMIGYDAEKLGVDTKTHPHTRTYTPKTHSQTDRSRHQQYPKAKTGLE